MDTSVKKVAVAGASGFIGKALIREISKDYQTIALSRGIKEGENNIEWRKCDLYSLLEAEQALKDVDVAFYLVHSMLPSARLTQSSFEDMDLILADNFGRAAKRAGVKQIIYLGGIIPEDTELSPHLKSRLEVEKTLASYDVPVTNIRASLIVGSHGSSFQIVENLVKRLPFLICPKWTLSDSQPVAVDDVVKVLHWCIGNPLVFNQTSDVGGADILKYIDLLKETARILGLKRIILPVPVFSAKLSRLWVSLVSGTPIELVKPLVESLRHPMVAKNTWIQEKMGLKLMTFSQAVEKVINDESKERQEQKTKKIFKKPVKEKNDVRSIQRLPLPQGRDAVWVAQEYTIWLPRFLNPFIRVEVDENRKCFFYIRFIDKPLLELSYSERSTRDRTLFYITGGLLADSSSKKGRLEFREVLDGKYILAAIHDFTPTLPWFIYNSTQALVHLWVMKNFEKYLKSLTEKLQLVSD